MGYQQIRAKRDMSIKRALEWAFGDECARIELDEVAESSGGVRPGVDMIHVLMQRGALGCQIDGGGVSHPAWEADVIASTVASLPDSHGGRRMAMQIADLARAGRAPDWMRDATPRCVPREWRNSKHGWRASVEVGREVVTVYRGRRTVRTEDYCPVTYLPTASQIAAARRNYLQWWGALLRLRAELTGLNILTSITLTQSMPPLEPWRH